MSVVVELQADIKNFIANLDKAQQVLDKFSDGVGGKLDKLGQSFERIGSGLSTSVTIPLKDFGVAALKAWGEAQKLEQGLQGLAGSTASSFNGALEQVTASIEQTLASVGEVIDKNFNITGLLERTAMAIQQLGEWFKNLSPAVQNIIIVFAGLVAIMGPLLVGIGSLMQWIPLVASGFTALMEVGTLLGTAFSTLTGPIGIAVAAVAAAVALIIYNWDSIQAYFTSGGGAKFWNVISSNAQALWEGLSTIFNQIEEFVISTWDSISAYFTTGHGAKLWVAITKFADALWGQVSFIFEDIKAVFVSFGEGVMEVFTAVSGFITGIWAKIGNNVINVVRTSFNIVYDIFDGVITGITGLLNIFTGLLKGNFVATILGVKDLFVSILTTIHNVAANKISRVSSIFAGLLKLIGADGLAKSLDDFADKIKPVYHATKIVAEASANLDVSINNKTSRSSKKKTENKTFEGPSVEVGVSAKNKTQNFGWHNKVNQTNINVSRAGRDSAQQEPERKMVSDPFEGILNSSAVTELSKGVTIPVSIPEESIVAVNEQLSSLTPKFETLSIDLTSAIGGALGDGMEALGEALATGGNVIDAIGASLLSSLGKLAVSVGKQMIAFGIAGIALKNLMKNPWFLIPAGAALVALGSAATASISKQVGSAGSGGGYGSSSYSAQGSGVDYSQFRGALYNNEKQVVELDLRGDALRGFLKQSNDRNTRLS